MIEARVHSLLYIQRHDGVLAYEEREERGPKGECTSVFDGYFCAALCCGGVEKCG